jgi:hypothetical protein
MQNTNDEVRELKAEIKRLRKTLSSLTPSLEVMLRRRGFMIYKKEPSDDLLLPDRSYMNRYYEKLKKYSFRLILRDIIKYQDYFTSDDVTRFATSQVSAGYLEFLYKSGIIETHKNGFRIRKRPVKSFGETLEWFIARLIEKDFQSETAWGIKFKGRKVGGDYDLIAKIESSILYMEVKSSPPKQIFNREITAFLNRVDDLSPEISIFFIDTELRMLDKIVPMFQDELKRRYRKILSVDRIVKELFHINKKIFIINSKGGISANIETALGFMLK